MSKPVSLQSLQRSVPQGPAPKPPDPNAKYLETQENTRIPYQSILFIESRCIHHQQGTAWMRPADPIPDHLVNVVADIWVNLAHATQVSRMHNGILKLSLDHTHRRFAVKKNRGLFKHLLSR